MFKPVILAAVPAGKTFLAADLAVVSEAVISAAVSGGMTILDERLRAAFLAAVTAIVVANDSLARS